MVEIAPRFTGPSADAADVMPVGAGDLSAMLRYDQAWEIHLSKTDFFAFEAKPYHQNINLHSPGHVQLSFAIPRETIRHFEQRLDYLRGSVVLEIKTDEGAVKAEAWGIMGRNTLVIAVEDSRPTPAATATFSIWRSDMQIEAENDRILGREVHRYIFNGRTPTNPSTVTPEDRLYNLGCGTLVAFADEQGLLPAISETTNQPEAHTATLHPKLKGSRYWLVITAACTYDGKPETVAGNQLKTAVRSDMADQLRSHLDWWADYWQTAYINLQGPDTDTLLRLWYSGHYSYASVAGGPVLPKFNGGPGLIHQDDRSWGWGYWWQNTREQIWPQFAANHLDHVRSALDFYDRNFMDCKKSTADKGKIGLRMGEWVAPGKTGLTVPLKQVSVFNPAALDQAMADRTMENVKSGYNARSLAQATELTQLMFDYVAFSGDTNFLQTIVSPWLKETTLFWLSWLRKGEDGQYHSMVTDGAEMWWKIRDSSIDLSAARYCFWHGLNYGTNFGYEPEFIAAVRDRAEHLAPLPLGCWTKRHIKPSEIPPGMPTNTTTIFYNDRSTDCYAPGDDLYDDRASHNVENPELYLVYPFALVDALSPKLEYERAVNTFRRRRAPNHSGWSQCPVQAARLRLDDAVDVIMDHAGRHARYPYGGWNSPAKKLSGTQLNVNDTPYFDAMGVNLTAFQETLLQSHPLTTPEKLDLTGGAPIALAPAARHEWSGQFHLLARGGFLVTADLEPGRKITHAVIKSQRGGKLQLANPFGNCQILRAGQAVFSNDTTITLNTQPGQRIEFSWKGPF